MSFESFKELLAFGVGKKLFGGNGGRSEADRLRSEHQHKEMLEAVKTNTRAIRAAGRSMDWIAMEGNIVTVGVTDFAQSELGELVFIELPAIGARLEAGEPAASVETINEPRDILAPLTGTVVAVNEALNQNPNLVNTAPESDGWLYKVKIANPAQLKAFGL